MSGKSIAQALEGLGSDTEMLGHLYRLEDALAAVLGAEEVECARCGRSELDLNAGEIPELADRLLAVVAEIQARMESKQHDRSRDGCPFDARRRAWERSNPERFSGERRPRNTTAEDGGAR